MNASWLGRIAYAPAFDLQRALADRRAAGEIADTLLLLEHDAVYTLGRRATDGEVLLDTEALAARGDEIRVIAGHFPLCTTELIGGRFATAR